MNTKWKGEKSEKNQREKVVKLYLENSLVVNAIKFTVQIVIL